MTKARSRTQIQQDFIRLSKQIHALQVRVDRTLQSMYKDLGWVRVHGRRRIATKAGPERLLGAQAVNAKEA